MLQVSSSIGVFFVYTLGSKFDWELVTGLCTFPLLILLTMSSFLTESPHWLFLKGKRREADAAVAKLYGLEVPQEFLRMRYNEPLQPQTQASPRSHLR